GETSAPVALAPFDNVSTFTQILADSTVQIAAYPRAVVDAANNKLLIVTEDDSNLAIEGKTHLFRCNLDGTACTDRDLSGLVGITTPNVGLHPSAVIDTVNQKLIIATTNNSGPYPNGLYLLICSLDGSSCTAVDAAANTFPQTGSNNGSLTGFYP